ncbi:TcdA/TcdB pore-forming domain-containing protein [Pseudomonas chlororaphis subsp. aurantiaca]|uniref:TcdA/TcdB pore-forming domain-containing protein n=1 Tax=Pseudomonas chlororaphis TaxID=587753 RepID=UPI0027DB8D40|nr:TcdA/TcdB pore-forming domain-containing protein [Pseudomonas chlororaphis]WMI97573.1 TcdA/TcdB pore-forming domain-containing protein [Pseudomonas chlororaphis subsp. aurantiaca]
MSDQSYNSLLKAAEMNFEKMKNAKKIQVLVQEIKENYKEHGKWTVESMDKKERLERLLEQGAYKRYSNDKPSGVSGLKGDERQGFIDHIKGLAADNASVDILVQGEEKVPLSSQDDSQLVRAEAFRILPKDFASRHAARSSLTARLTINVDKAHFNQLATALTQLFNDDNHGWLEQAKIMGPKNIGNRTDEVVIYLSRAGEEYARAIAQKLGELLPAKAFVDHTPTGMYQLDKGISYSETVTGDSTSHGKSRAKLIAAANARALLADTPVKDALQHVLQERGYNPHNPALLAQIVRDSTLKSGLAGMNDGTSSREGSSDISAFAEDPVEFAKTHTISADALLSSGALPAQGRAQLVKVGDNVYEVEYVEDDSNAIASSEAASVPAYFLGYNGANQSKATPAYVDIPKQAAEGSFLFTGSLTGCSVIVTELDADTYRVYHDGRVNSSLLYDNVVMAADFQDYQVFGTAEGMAAAYMQYVDGHWQLVLQRQEYQRSARGPVPKLRNGEEALTVLSVDAQVGERSLTKFTTYREQIHQKLIAMAAERGISSEGVADGVYEDGGFSLSSAAIAAWSALRTRVLEVPHPHVVELERQRRVLLSNTKTPNFEQRLKALDATLDFLKAHDEVVIREVGSVEKTWLWHQIKAKEGMGSTVRLDDAAIQAGLNDDTSNLATKYANTVTLLRCNGRVAAAFVQGIEEYRTLPIPGWNDQMSVLEMKQLFLTGELSPLEKGALSGRIEEKVQEEYIQHVLKFSADASENFQRAGSSFERLMPQDFFLALVGDKTSGRCLPLVRAMAVALAEYGVPGVNSLVEKLFFAAASPDDSSSWLLKNSLSELHTNVPARAATIERGKVGLAEVASLLQSTEATTMFALNTQAHSMMVGSVVTGEGRRFYFYDPNVGVFAFDDVNSFSTAMKQHFVKRKLGAYYGAFGTQKEPTFILEEIDSAKMAEVSVGNGLNVSDLGRTEELAVVIEQRREVGRAVGAQARVAEDALLRTALTTLDVEQWGARFDAASTRLTEQAGLDSRWMPVIANTEEIGEGQYRVQYINRDQLEEVRWVETSDKTFAEFRSFVDEHLSTLAEHYTLDHGQMRTQSGADVAAPDGLNAGFAVQTLIQWFAEKNRKDTANGIASSDLSMALKVHSYVNFLQMLHGTVQDVVKITELVRTALRGEVVAAETSLKDFLSTLGRTLNEGVGVLFGGIMAGLDAYELAHAENDTQKTLYATQLAFDAASLVTSLAGVAAGVLGASAAAAALGGAGVIIGGLAIGITALVRNFMQTAAEAEAVGHYFDVVDTAYREGGYRYDDENNVLVPLAGAVIKKLDLSGGLVEFDSQYIYRSKSGSTGSGKINYFFWAGDFPYMVRERSQAIEVRSGIGYEGTHSLGNSDSQVILLPATPKSYISYTYGKLPGATTRNDAGFDVIRRLENDKRLDYDFYIFPFEYTFRTIHQEFVATQIAVVLDSNSRQLVVPDLPKELHGYLGYEIEGAGGEYHLVLNEGVSIRLSSSAADSDTPSRWIIDTRQLEGDNISVASDRLTIGGIAIDIEGAQNERILIVKHDGELHEVDFAELSTNVLAEDAGKWDLPGESIEQHMRKLAAEHRLHGQYVPVESYEPEGYRPGRAFYDVANDRMLYTKDKQQDSSNAQLGAVVGDYAYFYDAEKASAWRVLIATGELDGQFTPFSEQSEGRIIRLWEEGGVVYLHRKHTLQDSSEVELTYRIQGDQLELVSVMGDEALQLSSNSSYVYNSLERMLLTFSNHFPQRLIPGLEFDTRRIEPTRAALMTVCGKDADGGTYRYWLRTGDGVVITPNLQRPADQPQQFEAGEQDHSAWPIPADLVLAGIMLEPAGEEIFFFYSKEQKVLFRQRGPGQTVPDANQPTALRVAIPDLANVLNLNGTLIAVTDDGRVARIDAWGQLGYEAVNEHWLKKHAEWWQDLASVTNSSATLAVFGVKGSDNTSVLPVWYHNGKVVVASSELHGKSLQFLGFEADGSTARLFDPQSGKLYQQPSMTADEVAAAFGDDAVLEASAQLPVATALVPKLHLQAVAHVDAGLRLTTVNGEILLRANNGDLQLVAVDKHWQARNVDRLPEALHEVAKLHTANGVVTLQGDATQGWFEVASGQIFSGAGIPASTGLRFLGVSPQGSTAFVYDSVAEALYQVGKGEARHLGQFSGVTRVDSSLLIQGASRDDLAPPLIAGVDSLVLQGGVKSDTYRLSKATWGHYRTVIIDNNDPDQAEDRLILPVTDSQKVLVVRGKEDLIFTDINTGTALVLRKVFGSEASAHQHLLIEMEDGLPAISLKHLVKNLSKLGVVEGGMVSLSLASNKQPATAMSMASPQDFEGPSLAKLSGAMAAFADTGGAREHLPHNRQAAQSVLVPSLS